eukprot:TRINITY_DN13205_c0_g1_i2.p1 TRINITY_DN13205_c0_g1~~TRINITY_DN13205_c0_g1_i2.p1  ORF type:complete len:624 (-),score=92.64 TRINITY_DN13205_c0_g1_i2:2-1873(-)
MTSYLLLLLTLPFCLATITIDNLPDSGGSWSVSQDGSTASWAGSFPPSAPTDGNINIDTFVQKLHQYPYVIVQGSDAKGPIYINAEIHTNATSEIMFRCPAVNKIRANIFMPNVTLKLTGNPAQTYFTNEWQANEIVRSIHVKNLYVSSMTGEFALSQVNLTVENEFYMVYDLETFDPLHPENSEAPIGEFQVCCFSYITAKILYIAAGTINVDLKKNEGNIWVSDSFGMWGGNVDMISFVAQDARLDIKFLYSFPTIVGSVITSPVASITATEIKFNQTGEYRFTTAGLVNLVSPTITFIGNFHFPSFSFSSDWMEPNHVAAGSTVWLENKIQQNFMMIEGVVAETVTIQGIGTLRTGQTGAQVIVKDLNVYAPQGSLSLAMRGYSESVDQIYTRVYGTLNVVVQESLVLDNDGPLKLGNISARNVDLGANGITNVPYAKLVINSALLKSNASNIILGDLSTDNIQIDLLSAIVEAPYRTIDITSDKKIVISTLTASYGSIKVTVLNGSLISQYANILTDNMFVRASGIVRLGEENDIIDLKGLSIVSGGQVDVSASFRTLLAPFETPGPTTIHYLCNGFNAQPNASSSNKLVMLGITEFVASDAYWSVSYTHLTLPTTPYV